MLTSMGHDCGQAADEREGVEDEAASAVAPRAAEVPDDLAVLAQHEAALGERRACHVPQEALERGARVRFDARCGVQGVAVGTGDEGATGQVERVAASGGWRWVEEARDGLVEAGAAYRAREEGGGPEQGHGRVLASLMPLVPLVPPERLWIDALDRDEATVAQDALDACAGVGLHAGDVEVGQWGRRMEGRYCTRMIGDVHTVEHEGVAVWIDQ